MLDVHPPHAATHTWRDFFIHIATIVVGLLIAVGLDQGVESLHHHHQVAETRAALRAEHEKQRVQLDRAVVEMRRERASLINNLMVLLYIRQHPGTPQSELPGVLTWHNDTLTLPTGAWRAASQTPMLSLLPEDEVRSEGDFYSDIDYINQANDKVWQEMSDAYRYSFRDGDATHLSAAELDVVVERTQRTMEALNTLAAGIMNLKEQFPEYAQSLTSTEISQFSQKFQNETDPALARPIARTIERIDAAGKLKDYFPQSAPGKQ